MCYGVYMSLLLLSIIVMMYTHRGVLCVRVNVMSYYNRYTVHGMCIVDCTRRIHYYIIHVVDNSPAMHRSACYENIMIRYRHSEVVFNRDDRI